MPTICMYRRISDYFHMADVAATPSGVSSATLSSPSNPTITVCDQASIAFQKQWDDIMLGEIYIYVYYCWPRLTQISLIWRTTKLSLCLFPFQAQVFLGEAFKTDCCACHTQSFQFHPSHTMSIL